MKNTKTHEDLKEMSIYVYNDGNGKIPDGWKLVSTDSNNKTGYYSETYKKGKEIAIVYRGTDLSFTSFLETGKDFFGSDLQMAADLSPAQLKDARNTYNAIKQSYPSSKVVLSGHSLGGSLAQLISAETGTKAVTFSAYGTGKILAQKGYSQAEQRLLNITNYGNEKDPIFTKNINYQPGVSYITNTNLAPQKTYNYTREPRKLNNLREELPKNNPHKLQNMDSLDKAVKIENESFQQPEKVLHGGISYTETDTLAQNQSFSDTIRNKWRNMQQSRNSRLQNRSSKGKKSSASGTTNGKWITINGNHVLIEK